MNEMDKKILMESVFHETDIFKKTFNQFKLVFDESFFDYELLKAALKTKKRVETVNFLIDIGCRVRNPNKTKCDETPLHLAMETFTDSDLIILKLLIKGASIYDKNCEGETPLYAAFKKENYKNVDVVLDYISKQRSANLDKNNKDDVLHFHIACITNHLDGVKQYLEFKFDVNRNLSVGSAEFDGLSPLHYAMRTQDMDLYKLLISQNGDLSVRDQEGLTPLHFIYYQHYFENSRSGCNGGKKNNQNTVSLITPEHRAQRDNIYSEVFRLKGFFIYFVEQAFTYGNETKFINSVDKNGLSHFHLCCSINNPQFVKVFIDKGVDVNSSTSLSCPVHPRFSPLHFAVKHSCPEVVELLLKHGADTSQADKFGLTPLHYTLTCTNYSTDEKVKMIKVLLNYNACPTAVDKQGNTLIHMAFYKLFDFFKSEEKDVFDALMSKIPIELNLCNKDNLSLFHIVCTRSDVNLVNNFLNSGVVIDSSVTSGDYSGYTALHFAVLFNQKEVVEVLLKRNARVDVETSVLKKTPLHLACEHGWLKYCELVKSKHKSLDLDCTSHRTNQFDIIKLLLLHGATIDAKDSSGSTPLLQACVIKQFEHNKLYWPTYLKEMIISEISIRTMEIIKILLSNNADINVCTNEKLSILYVMSKSNLLKISDESILECFITRGADINTIDDDGLTPLHFAVKCQNIGIVEILLKHKANVDIQCKNLKTPLQTAIEINTTFEKSYSRRVTFYRERDIDREICDILLKNSTDINKSYQHGRTLLHDAVSIRNIFLIKQLLYYGIDVNIKDSFGNTAVDILSDFFKAWTVPPSLRNETDSMYWDERRDCIKAFIYIYIHVQKLLALGLYVSKKIQNVCTQLHQFHRIELHCLDTVFDKCVNEIDRLKLKKIDNCTSLYNILVKESCELSIYVKNKSLIDIVENPNIDKEFPIYAYLLKLQFKKSLVRNEILKSARTLVIYFNELYLPNLCCESIFKYLNNEDIINLKAAAYLKSSDERNSPMKDGKICRKRKLNDNYSKKKEPTIKLRKTKSIFSTLKIHI